MPKDIVLVLFGGSGAEIEVCKRLDRHFISAEIDKKYHKVILDRIKNGRISEQHRLISRIKAKQTCRQGQLLLIE